METSKIADEKLWMIDDSSPYDPVALEGIRISPELQAKLDAIFDEDNMTNEVKPAA